jgi:hypothetical protein
MNQKTLAIVVIAVVIVAVIGVGAYWALSSGGGNDGGDNNGGDTNGGTTTGVADASSLQFSVDISGGESQGTYTYSAKNIGTSNMMIRIDISTADVDFDYIVNGAQQKAWTYVGGEWMDLSDAFSNEWDSWNLTLQDYTNNLSSWTGAGDWTYTDANGYTIRVYDITVNPSLADSLFEP